MATLIIGNGFPIASKKIGPNDLCPCRSGKKAKKCCGTETQYYYTKLTPHQEREKKLKEEAQAKQNQHTTEE